MASNTNTNPFLNFDYTKVMAGFDATKMTGDFAKMADQFKVPGVDLQALVANQRRNFELLEAANRKAMEGFQAVAQRQAEFFSATMQETQNAFEKVSKSKTPEDATAKQVDFLKSSYEKSVANFHELSEMSAEIASEAGETITSCVFDGLDEMKPKTAKSQKTK